MPSFAMIVIERIVTDTAIIPESQRSRLPLEASRKRRLGHVVVEPIQQGFTFGRGHTLEPVGVSSAEIKPFLTGLRVRSNKRMNGGAFNHFQICSSGH